MIYNVGILEMYIEFERVLGFEKTYTQSLCREHVSLSILSATLEI